MSSKAGAAKTSRGHYRSCTSHHQANDHCKHNSNTSSFHSGQDSNSLTTSDRLTTTLLPTTDHPKIIAVSQRWRRLRLTFRPFTTISKTPLQRAKSRGKITHIVTVYFLTNMTRTRSAFGRRSITMHLRTMPLVQKEKEVGKGYVYGWRVLHWDAYYEVTTVHFNQAQGLACQSHSKALPSTNTYLSTT